ncbi:DUF4166 domain-containing protein [uncultured Pelagimonas sp.]|uniref:DUF4166 domain-containing protein n=1 Tax=uncultured Pelagimonas sp. TaxID=1618102 RepID=UPI002618CB1E|nr:DUF4166 domain-containing protein [uncultured Pelagimonas sp.]
MTVYSKWLGDQFDDLPDACQDLHAGYGRFAGRITVSYAPLPFVAKLGRLFGFAPAADDVALVFEARQEAGRDYWRRMVGDTPMESELWVTTDGLLAEKLGPVTVTMRPILQGRQLILRVADFHFGRLAIPSWLQPEIEATEFAEAGRYRFEVTICLPIFGTQIVHYSGWLDTFEALPDTIPDRETA